MRVWCECSSGFENAWHILMMVRDSTRDFFRVSKSLIIVTIMLLISLSPITNSLEKTIDDIKKIDFTDSGDTVWIDGGQPWPHLVGLQQD